MSSTALYKAFIEAGASEDNATRAAADVIQVSQLPQLATKTDIARLEVDIGRLERNVAADIARLETNMAKQESRLIKWMVSLQLATLVMIATFIEFL